MTAAQHFADRVKDERVRLGWSQAELSRRMIAAGYAVDQAAISKIEASAGSGRQRRIDLDEAVGFATVFGQPLLDMLGPLPEPRQAPGALSIAQEQEVRRLLKEVLSQAPKVATPRSPWRRITPALLQEVAEVYRAAVGDGFAPTKAVAQHFDLLYTTASRWVLEARRAGALGAADSTRGGEVTEGTGENVA
jgi:transcriptional regulator with XRE-family HTH domain